MKIHTLTTLTGGISFREDTGEVTDIYSPYHTDVFCVDVDSVRHLLGEGPTNVDIRHARYWRVSDAGGITEPYRRGAV